MGNLLKVPTTSIKRNIYYHGEMVEPDKYIDKVEKFKHELTIKD